jgi:iron complex transport system ATP-binding protein
MTNDHELVSTENLSFSYNGSSGTVFEGLRLSIPPRSVTAILGPNGSGKTTLLHLMLGFLRPKNGVIRLAGRPQHHYSRREMGRFMALVPQNEHLAFNLSAVEYVLLGRAPYLGPLQAPRPEDVDVAVAALRAAGAEDLSDRSIDTLSGGEQQLVAIARALAQEPRLLLMDEPTAHLDLGNQGRVLEVVRRLAADDVTVAFTTHNPNLAASLASHVILMSAGEVLAAAPTRSVLTEENLSRTYGVPVDVVEVQNRQMIWLRDGSSEVVEVPVVP